MYCPRVTIQQTVHESRTALLEEECLTSVSTARSNWKEWPWFQNEAMALQGHRMYLRHSKAGMQGR